MAVIALGKHAFTTTAERDAYAVLRRKYAEAATKQRARFLARFDTYRSADELFEEIPNEVDQTISHTVTLIADDVAAHRVYHLDTETIRAELVQRIETIRGGFDRVQEAYYAILGKAAELEAQRAEAMENRALLVGGGFGIEGAARGMAIAAAANVATGVLHGLANLTGKAASALGDAKKKRLLLQSPSTKADLADFVERIVLQGHLIVAETVNANSSDLTFEIVPEDDRKRATALAENVAAGRVPDSEIHGVLLQALQLDPFAELPWCVWIDRLGDKSCEVENSAGMMGVHQLAAYKQELGNKRRDELAWSTPEQCAQSAGLLETYTEHLGLSFEAERIRIQQLIDKLDIERRTVAGTIFETLDEANEARAAQEEAKRVLADEKMRTHNGITYNSLEEMWEARKKAILSILQAILIIVFCAFAFLVFLIMIASRTRTDNSGEAQQIANEAASEAVAAASAAAAEAARTPEEATSLPATIEATEATQMSDTPGVEQTPSLTDN